ncbi:MAG: hypothetical protein ACN6OP_18820 [Pseudomonadales bacterium]
MLGDLNSDDLKLHLKNNRITAEGLFQIHVIQRRAYIFSKDPDGLRREMDFRKEIAQSIGLSINEVNIVGSAQLGYSIKPHARLREMDAKFNATNRLSDKSDIDVSIVSKQYFEKVHSELSSFTKEFNESWEYTAYYRRARDLERFDVKRADYQFYRYFSRGWIRPDFCPDGFKFAFTPVVDGWKNLLQRKISLGIYRDWRCLKDYQEKAFNSLRIMAIKGEL